MKQPRAVKNTASGYDLVVEKDAGNPVRIKTGNKSVRFWEGMRDLSVSVLRSLNPSSISLKASTQDMKFLWVIKKNSDFTEGRGSMMFHSVWDAPREKVAEWLDKQPGVFGCKHTSLGGHEKKKWSEQEHGMQWRMEAVPVFTDEEEIDESERTKKIIEAVGKLTREEVELLGIDERYRELFK
jgi:hypothetical protein